MRDKIFLAVLALVICVFPILVGCGQDPGARHQVVSGLNSLPSDSLTDWVSYSDAVAVVRIAVDSGESALTPEEESTGEGLTTRNVVAAVERVVWTRDPASRKHVPTRFPIVAPGWIYKNSSKVPYVMDDGNRLELGEIYLMPIALYDDAGWGPVGFGLAMTPDQNRVAQPGQNSRSTAKGAASTALAGLDVAAIAAKLGSVTPDPVAAAHEDLDPIGRFRAVTLASRARQATQPPAPGEH